MSSLSLSQNDGEKVPTYSGNKLLSITDRLLQKSNNAIIKIDENIDLTTSLRSSNNLISQIDTKIDGLTGNLQQYQYYLSQLNSLSIRSEFFEAQLNMLEAHNRLNSLRSSEGMPSLNDWKDDDLNWRTTEATLENLYLEYQYLTKQMEQLSDPEAFKAVLTKQTNPAPVFNEEASKPRPTLQSKMSMADLNLKPMRILSRKQEKQRRNSLDINSKKRPVASIPTIYRPQPHTQNRNHQFLPTPETSFDTSMEDTAGDYFSYHHDETMISPLSNIKHSSSRRNSHIATNKHTRSSSLPESIVSNMLDTVKFNLADDPLSPENTKNRKFSLRHFISHETGLKTKGLIVEEDEEDIKDSEFLSSPVSINMESYLKPKPIKESKGKDLEDSRDESVVIEGEEPLAEEITVFEHKLNRSNSCDSIFSTMKTEPYVQMTDNKQQTMNWMKQFSKPQSSSAKESNVTTLSVNNLSSSISSSSRKALTDLVSQNTSNPKPTPPNRFPFLFAAKKSSPLAATSDTSSTLPISNSSSSPYDHHQETTARSIPGTPTRQLSVDDSSSYHSFESSYSNSPQHKQWSLLLNRFKPKGIVPSSSLVTSEIGKPIPRAQPITISSQDNHYNKPHISSSLAPSHDKIKGSFSTLTIGPNRSKIVQHGESSTLGQSLVVTSRVSHAALRDALDNDFSFQ